jgi:hypothetical protein
MAIDMIDWEQRAKELAVENAELRERLRFHDTFLSTVRAACLKAQGIQKNERLGVRAVADRGLRIIFDKE